MKNQIVLNRRGLERLSKGHPWIFRGDIALPLNKEAGELVPAGDHSGRVRAWGIWNPDSALCFRVIVPGSHKPDMSEIIETRLSRALSWRKRYCPDDDAFRWVHGESDGLPGLVVDLFGDVAVVQLLSVGWSVRRDMIVEALRKRRPLRAVVLRNDVKSLRKEGLKSEKGILWGSLEEEEEVPIRMGALKAAILPFKGQKTGAYLDVRHFPTHLENLCRDARVLDGFCFQGGFSLHALKYGASEVVALDQSQEALDGAERNRVLNGLPDRVTWKRANVFDALRELESAGERFRVAVMDPPPFAPGKASISSARRGYKDLALRSLRLLEPGGTLFFFSCSHAFGRDALLETLGEASADAGRTLRVVEEFHQPMDHPVTPCIPETDYLKGFHLEVDA